MKIVLLIVSLSVFTGCASSQPSSCSSHNPEVCVLEEQVASIKRQQEQQP